MREDIQRLELPESFWDQFVTDSWRRKPVLIRQAIGGPIVSPEELYRALCAMTRESAGGLGATPWMTIIDGTTRTSDPEACLPIDGDGDWSGFQQRIAHSFAGRDYQLYIPDGIQRYCTPLWRRSRDFMARLLERVGLPQGGIGIECFSGNYRETHTGIHLDTADNFSFVIEGRKRMLFWPREMFSAQSSATVKTHQRSGVHDYMEHIDNAMIMDGEPGDVMYWPREYWHVAVSTGRNWATTINLAMWCNTSAAVIVKMAVERALGEAFDLEWEDPPQQLTPSGMMWKHAQSLPPAMADAWADYLATMNSQAMADAVRGMWSTIVSSGGFLVPPKPHGLVRIDSGSVVIIDPNYPIITIPVADGRIDIVANGHLIETPATAMIVRMIEDLNAGRSIDVASMLAASATMPGGTRADQVCALLEFLEAVESIKRV